MVVTPLDKEERKQINKIEIITFGFFDLVKVSRTYRVDLTMGCSLLAFSTTLLLFLGAAPLQ